MYQGPADARRLPAPDFKVGDQVFVKGKYFRSTRPSKKLSEKNLGPYPIIAQVGTLSFTIRLPNSMRAVHPVFHVSQLEPAMPNTIPNWSQSPPPPVEVDGEPKYEITEILDSKLDQRRCQCPLLYLVRWAGYEGTDDETSWLVATELGHATELVTNYHKAYPLLVLLRFLPPRGVIATTVTNISLSLHFSPLADLFIIAVNTSKWHLTFIFWHRWHIGVRALSGKEQPLLSLLFQHRSHGGYHPWTSSLGAC